MRQSAVKAGSWQSYRGMASSSDGYDVVVIGGGEFEVSSASGSILKIGKDPVDTWLPLRLLRWD